MPRTFSTLCSLLSPLLTGNTVYLLPAEPGVQSYIGRIEDLMQHPGGDRVAIVTWFFRPAELELEHPLEINAKEIFASDDTALLPVDSSECLHDLIKTGFS
jgi:hypothetical protein